MITRPGPMLQKAAGRCGFGVLLAIPYPIRPALAGAACDYGCAGDALRPTEQLTRRCAARGLPRRARTQPIVIVVGLASLFSLVLPAAASAKPTIAVRLSPGTIVADGTSTSTATATVTEANPPPAMVGFSSSDPGVRFGAVTKNKSTYTARLTSSTVARTVTITATDKAALPPVSAQAPLTQLAGPAKTIVLAVQPGSIAADGQSRTTATATVADAHGNPVSSDNVTFSASDRADAILQVTNNRNGTYSALIQSSTTADQVTIAAVDNTARIRAAANLIQTADPSTVSLVAVPSSAVTNQTVTLFAAVYAREGSGTGTIDFLSGGAAIAGCTGRPVSPSSPTAACQTAFAAATSPEQITAVFTPSAREGRFGATASLSLSVTPDLSATSLALSNTVYVGTRTTYTATITPPAGRPGPTEPSGSVEFLDGGQPIGACLHQPMTGGAASCTVSYQAAGSHSISAQYSGDANFEASSASAQAVKAVPAPRRVLGIITSSMQWNFAYSPTYTRVLTLVVNGVKPGATVVVTCQGKGCPYAKRSTVAAKTVLCGPKGKRCPTHGTVRLAASFKHRLLAVGTKINVKIVRSGWIGKYYLFTVRARRGPQVQIACLAPGGTRPGVGC